MYESWSAPKAPSVGMSSAPCESHTALATTSERHARAASASAAVAAAAARSDDGARGTECGDRRDEQREQQRPAELERSGGRRAAVTRATAARAATAAARCAAWARPPRAAPRRSRRAADARAAAARQYAQPFSRPSRRRGRARCPTHPMATSPNNPGLLLVAPHRAMLPLDCEGARAAHTEGD